MEKQLVELQTDLGMLRGQIRQSTISNKSYYTFQGVPYGKPPVGDLRFKAPQPFGSWVGIRDATEDGDVPVQAFMPLPGMDDLNIFPKGGEDCLNLNIYMNELPEKKLAKKPVMFSIHGGAFEGGSSSFPTTGPDYLLEEGDVIVVAINYRCGPFGFLSLEDDDVPGNAGLKDQTLALQWVQENIHSFGGDSNNVTIFGISAGGASVHYHLISPSSKGLFHKAIVQSGFATNPWAMQETPRKRALLLAKLMGYTSDENKEVLQFLQAASADDILAARRKIDTWKDFGVNSLLLFTPSIEVSGDNPFLADHPANLLREGKINSVPVILGTAQKEGSVLAFFHKINDVEFDKHNKNPHILVPHYLGLKPGSSDEEDAAKEIQNFYFKGNPISWENVDDYMAYTSDCQFNIGMVQARAGLLEKTSSPVYNYLMTNHTRCICAFPIFDSNEHLKKLKTTETCHGADVGFLYSNTLFPQRPLTPGDEEAIRKHCRAWTTFAIAGDPNHDKMGATWEKDSLDDPCFMDIGEKWTLIKGIPFAERMNFWMKLKSKYNSS